MSHLIQTKQTMESPCVLKVPLKQVIAVDCRAFVQKNGCDYIGMEISQLNIQQSLIKGICAKFAHKESFMLQIQNQRHLKKQFLKLKSKFSNTNKCSDTKGAVLKYFDGNQETKSISSLLRSSEKIQIQHKYRSRILQRLENIREISEISKDKENYYKWNDMQNNSVLNSSNFNKMNFVFERIKGKSEIFHRGSLSVSTYKKAQKNKNQASNLRQSRKLDKIDLKPKQYIPKSKIQEFRLKNKQNSFFIK